MISEVFLSFGPIGMILLVTAYISMLIGKLSPDTYKFLFSNLLGAFILMLNGLYCLNGILQIVYPSINIVWVIGTTIQIYLKHANR